MEPGNCRVEGSGLNRARVQGIGPARGHCRSSDTTLE